MNFFSRPHGRRRRRHTHGRSVELLEQRALLTSAVGWANAPDLSISLAPDGTSVAGHESNLHEVLDRVAPRTEWVAAIESAFAAWTTHIDANVHFTEDSGHAFGVSGAVFDDPRFGDVRVAAIPSAEDTFAFSVAHDEFVAGTWSGDIVFNSNARFASLDELYGVAMHEAGHVLGLHHSDDPSSPMFEHGIPSSVEPTSEDIEELQNLYGAPKMTGEGQRAQVEDPAGDRANGEFADAVVLNPTTGFKYGRYTLEGRIRNTGDVDVYKFEGHQHLDAQTDATSIVIRSTERGGLIPQATLYMENGQPVRNVTIVQNGNGTLILESASINPRVNYYLQIEAAASGEVDIGDYSVVIASRPEGVQATEFLKGQVKQSAPETQHTMFVARAQLLNLALVVKDSRSHFHENTAVAVAIHDSLGRLVATTSAGPGELRSLPSVMLRAGTYYVTVRGESEGALPRLKFSLIGVQSDQESGPLPSDPTGDPAFPCESSPDFCYTDGTVSPDPMLVVPGLGGDPPELEPFVVPWPWVTWWAYDDGVIWITPVDDLAVSVSGSETLIDVTGNDVSVGAIEVQAVTQPAVGAATIDVDGRILFSAPDDFSGTLTFDYTVGSPQISIAPDDLAADDQFGSSVAVYGSLAVVGSPYSGDNDAGAAYVYQRDGAEWLFVQKLVSTDAAAGDRFGTAVAVHGSTIVVTSPRDDDFGANSGGGYVFEFDPALGQFVEHTKLVDLTGNSKDLFGDSVAIDAHTIVVGGRTDDGLGTNSGSAFVFERAVDGSWGFVERLKASNVAAFSQFGSSVDVSGDTIVVGARRADAAGVDSGAAYVFVRGASGPTAFSEVAVLLPLSLSERDEFGSSVAVHGDSIVVGAPLHDFAGNDEGAAWLFEMNASGDWEEVAVFEGQNSGDKMGSAVDVFEETVAVASPTADAGMANAGLVRLFNPQPDGSWMQSRELTADARSAGDQFGSSVSISRNTLTVGSARSDLLGGNAGQLLIEDLRVSTATVTVDVGQALHAASGSGSAVAEFEPLIRHALKQHLRRAEELLAFGGGVTVVVRDLPGQLLGLAVGNRILIDSDAAGHGWYVDTTLDDLDDDQLSGRVDLLTVIAHELGHLAGHDDIDDHGLHDELMFESLQPGVRRQFLWG